ncbi:hypothetical protein IWW56_000719 [Coemansia sp. RSA 2131]|nr:hypothetical protein IWW56_000719 [Coemansia sp. RSA 2131]
MREVITLQFGENANYVGAHFWNLQEAYADEHRTGELFTQRSNKPSVPRALVFDAVGNFGAQALEDDLQSAGNDEIDEDQALWTGAKEVHRQPLYPKHTDSAQPARMKFWSDFVQTKLSPHAMHVVSGVEFGNSLGEMNTFQEGLQVFAGTDSRGDVLEGNFRGFAEECDHLQGFQVLADAFGGFAGYGSAFMAKIRDEYPKTPILLYNVGRSQSARQLRNAQLMDAAVSVASNSEVVSMSVPLFTPTPITKLNAHIHITDNDFYQTSAFMATNVAQWSHCLQSGRRIMDEIISQVTQQEYYTLAESLLAPGLHVPDIDRRSGLPTLADADKIIENSFVGCSSSTVNQISTTAGQLIVDRGTSMHSMLSDRYPSHAYLKDPAPVQLPRVFPQIFQGIDKQGYLASSSGPVLPAENAKQLRMAGMLCTSPASLGYLQQLHTAVKTEHSRHFKDYERETIVRRHSTQASEPKKLPLAGIRVLDMTRILAGPYCTMLLGDLGAEIIKVEHPLRGDDTRTWGPPFKSYKHPKNTTQTPSFPGESAYYLSVNRNKKSIAVDMKKESGRRILTELASKCDVLVENFVPGKLAEMQLGYKDLQLVNPRLVYASITGYGQTGPYRNKPGYDVIIEAEAGLMHITGEEDGPPVKVGVAVTDIMTGLYTHGAIMAALLARDKTGHGQHIDASLLQTQTSILANIASNYLIGGQEATRWGTRHPSIAPYQVFATTDGSVCIGAGNNTQFASLCNVIGMPDLALDKRFVTNADRVANRRTLIQIIEDVLSTKTTSEVLAMLENSGLPFGPVNNLQQTFDHPQVQARNVVRQVEHPFLGPIKMVGPAVEYSDAPVGEHIEPPPMLGQHTAHVLKNVLGYSDQQIQDAVKSGGAALYSY